MCPDATPYVCSSRSSVCAVPAARAAGLASCPGVSADDFIGRVQQELSRALPGGDATLEAVARRLGLSPASLYRRLRERGAEFTHLLRQLRYDLAVSHVREQHLPLTEVALLLGYSELSAFSRAFRRWTGVSPARYRRVQASRPAPRRGVRRRL